MTGFMIGIVSLNLILWLIFFIRFKKIFSTDSIVEKTREQLNKMISDIDKSTERDVYLSTEASKRIQNLINQEDEKMEMFIQATSRLRDMIAEADRINKLSNNNSSIFQDFNKIEPKKNNYNNKKINAYLKNSSLDNSNVNIIPDQTYQTVKSEQGDLFEEEKTPIIKTQVNVTEDGAAYKEVPLINTKIYEDQFKQPVIESSVQPGDRKISLAKKVQKLYNQGMNNEAIASELSCSITEVDLIIAML